MISYSAYVPCFNNASSVARTLVSLRLQLPSPAEVVLVDDGSTDDSPQVAVGLNIPVYLMGRNAGRGAVRAKAMEIAQHGFVLFCDATNQLPPDFMARALPWFDDPSVAGVFGRIWQKESRSLADRWRGRHLLKMRDPMDVEHHALLNTYACVLRRSAVLQVGNFDCLFRHSEDADLGRRLLEAGFDVIYDPTLHVYPRPSKSIREVLERYWRWYAGSREEVSFVMYAKLLWYSIRVLVPGDLSDRDPWCVPVSLFCPHYQFWKSFTRRLSGRVQM
ncbi:MAG: glycosyltransferase family 2 protein [Prochlorococcaceae cyanobacterium]